VSADAPASVAVKPRWRRWLVRVALLVALLLAAEIILRITGQIYLSRMYVRDLTPGGVRILCLGESSTQGLGVPYQDSYPAQLQARLNEHYHRRFDVIVPPHVGQNTSQVANRVAEYLDEYHPKLVVIMVGVNNEWALRESHIGRFLTGSDAHSWSVSAQIALDGVRLFRVARYLWLRVTSHGADDERWVDVERMAALGHPGFTRYPPPREVYAFALRNQDAFFALWHSDVKAIIEAVQRGGAQPLLMTYHIPGWVPVEAFVRMAEETGAPLVRNDLAFAAIADKGTLADYLLADHWHPNKRGYAIIADDVFQQITKLDLLGLH
jgi:lysophospholipase L1-like esterase